MPKPTEADRRVAKALVPILVTWPEEGMPPERLAAYVLVLEDLEEDLLQAAVKVCLASCRFFPKPADIRNAAFELRTRGENLPDPMGAWGEVLSEISRVGSYGSPIFSSELITKAVRYVGGWQRLCLSENMASDRARFVEAYSGLLNRHEKDVQMLPAVREQVELLAGRLSADRRLARPAEE